MNENTETTEEVIEEEFTDPDGRIAVLEDVMSFDDMAKGRGEGVEETAEGEEVAEEETETEVAVETETEKVAVTEPFLTLADGTGVTREEALAGYTRTLDYTQKTMDLAADKKEVAKFSSIIDAMMNDSELLDKVEAHMAGKKQVAAPAQDIREMKVPEGYQNDSFVTQIVPAFNELLKEVAVLKGGQSTMKQEATNNAAYKKDAVIYHQRVKEAYDKLTGQMGTAPNPKDFINKMEKHFESKGLTPQARDSMIIGPDSGYFSANVAEAFRDDVGAVKKDKVNSEREKRKPKGADKRALKATGKPPKTTSQKVPRLPDGSLDMSKFMGENPVWDKDKQG